MCLVLVVWRSHARFPCILAANRDEFHARASEAAHWWPDRPQLLAGRDRVAGGTWLALRRDGAFAALTNFRDPQSQRRDAPSRGALVVDLLAQHTALDAALAHLVEVGPRYNPFNLLYCDGERLGVYESARGSGRELPPGIYGLSNHLLDTPWPKVERAKSRLATAIDGIGADSAPILELLRDDRPAADHELPRTGVSLEWERLLSSAFVRSPDYGTRCSTLIRIGDDGRSSFEEWLWDRDGAQTALTSLRFDLDARR
ncbi:MAG: NRDE family protein [Gammaproteobacteria bacterium]|nr:NRDE family protein [Gammaproteobacteria bacterium]